jgi:hypothetical protein
LYNLKKDIGEKYNLADQMPAKVREMGLLIDQFLRDSGAIVPKPNPAYRPDRRATTTTAPASRAKKNR